MKTHKIVDVTGLCFSEGALLATTSTDGRGALVALGKSKRTLFDSEDAGLLSVAQLHSGRLVVGAEGGALHVLSPKGQMERTLDTALASVDFVEAHGECAFAATAAYSNAASWRVHEWNVDAGTSKALSFKSSAPLSLTSAALVRPGDASLGKPAKWGVDLYRFQGKLEHIATPFQRPNWAIASTTGLWIGDMSGAATLIDAAHKPIARVQGLWGACLTANEQWVLLCSSQFLENPRDTDCIAILDGKSLELLEEIPYPTEADGVSFPCRIACNDDGHIAFVGSTGVRVLQREGAKPTALSRQHFVDGPATR